MPRLAILEKEKCHPDKCGNWLCIRLCPINRMGDECITKGKDGKAFIDPEMCNGCGICPKRCPFGAIHIINLPDELCNQPIHQYGKNGFHLYNLPVPMFGKVVGIIGRNGIGKSTAIKILAGQLKPNLGQELEAPFEELMKFFKGTEAQIYFEKMKKGQVTVSYKPQQVDLIPKTFSGTPRKLLEQADKRGKLNEVVKQLELEKVLDSDISKISGGELQRVAIAATVLKEANVYIFDEPTSFLDIKQRLKISKFLKELATPDVAVMVVEHDLIILDYLSDIVNIMYGKENCYGIVSQPKAAKAGINTFLEGYLRDENMRFRDYPIKFSSRPPMKLGDRPSIIDWTGLKVKLGNFSLDAPKGQLKRKEDVGMLGENGIGKTTFVKMLAGVQKPDAGSVDCNVKVAYKPQYVEASAVIVADILRDAQTKYEIELMRPLNLGELMERRLDHLSGGQLQRVAIAYCLSQDADLYLMDEPSAYLDVEQRLGVSKVIREFMEAHGKAALVVDHDLLFLDYLSHRLMVCDGEPARSGIIEGPFDMGEGMNRFLKDLGITFRRDQESMRPRANKLGSQMDSEQKRTNKLYYD